MWKTRAIFCVYATLSGVPMAGGTLARFANKNSLQASLAGYGPSQVQAELDPNVPLYPNSTVRLSHVAPNRGGVGTPFREIGQMVTSWVIPPYPVPGQGDDCGPISRAERGRLGPDFSTRMFFNYQRRTSL